MERISLLEEMASGFTDVNSGLSSIVKAAKDIEGSISSVDELNRLIEDVAEQTNLLSMNAAIEAVRAGVSGIIGRDEISQALMVMSASSGDVDELYQDVKMVMTQMMEMIIGMENLMQKLLIE